MVAPSAEPSGETTAATAGVTPPWSSGEDEDDEEASEEHGESRELLCQTASEDGGRFLTTVDFLLESGCVFNPALFLTTPQ